MSEKQEKVFLFIKNYISENRISPSVREIGAGVGIKSTATVQNYLDCLEEQGYIMRKEKSQRSIRIV